MKQTLNNGESYGSIRTKLNDMFTELYNSVTNALGNITQLASSIFELAGTGRTTETVKGNADGISTLNTALLSHKEDNTSHGGIQHKNILHNWDFRNPVNQRGLTTYPSVTQTQYTIDRWTTASWYVVTEIGVGYVEFTEASGGGQSSAQAAKQTYETTLPSGIYTLSIMLSDGTIKHATGSISPVSSIGITEIDWSFVATEDSVYIVVNGEKNISVSAVKLELGNKSTLANDPPADFGEQLLLCQRYYQKHTTNTVVDMDLRPSMRITPTKTAITGGYAYSADL